MSTYIPSNVSPEEFFTHYCTDSNAVAYVQEMMDKMAAMQKQIASLEKALELTQEQVSFAQDLVETIDTTMSRAVSLKQLRKDYTVVRENTYFEI